MIEEGGLGDDIEHRLARRHRQRIAAKRAAVRADHHALRRALGGEAGADREAAADALGDRHDVGGEAIMFVREELAGARDAALDLVEDQQRAGFVGERAQAGQEFVARGADAALALDRFEQEAADVRTHGSAHRRQIAEGEHGEAIEQRGEPVAQLGLIGGADRAERAAVEGVAEGDDAEALGMAVRVVEAAARLDRAFERFGTRVGEEDGVGEGKADEALGEAGLCGHLIQVAGVHQRARLARDGRDQMRVSVAEAIGGDARREIEPAAAVRVEQIRALAAHRRDFGTGIDGHEGGDRHGACSQRKRAAREGPPDEADVAR